MKKPSDDEIVNLYKNAKALLLISKGEGFGLPLVEAANYDLPIVCSDIPVFHEIAGTYATFVDINDSDKLANDLANWYSRFLNGDITKTLNMPRLTWKESVSKLYSVLFDNNWYRNDL